MGFVIIDEQALTVAAQVKQASLPSMLNDNVNIRVSLYSRKNRQRGGIERDRVAGMLSQWFIRLLHGHQISLLK